MAWLRESTRLPLVIKGILDPADARRAVEHGASAIVVSNHGGRQLDGAVPSAAALPAVCETVMGRCEVLLDSGIRAVSMCSGRWPSEPMGCCLADLPSGAWPAAARMGRRRCCRCSPRN